MVLDTGGERDGRSRSLGVIAGVHSNDGGVLMSGTLRCFRSVDLRSKLGIALGPLRRR